MESDGKKNDWFSGCFCQVFSPGQILFPGTFVQTMQENDRFIPFFFSGWSEYGIIECFIFLDMVVGNGTEVCRCKFFLEFVDFAGSYRLCETKGDYI